MKFCVAVFVCTAYILAAVSVYAAHVPASTPSPSATPTPTVTLNPTAAFNSLVPINRVELCNTALTTFQFLQLPIVNKIIDDYYEVVMRNPSPKERLTRQVLVELTVVRRSNICHHRFP